MCIRDSTYMLDKPVDEVITDEQGKFVGVRSGEETVKANMVIGDPSYFHSVKGKSLVRETAKVVRAICILKHPIPSTDNSDSVQLIIPQNQVGRKHDIYIAEVSHAHNVCPRDLYIAQVSTIVETDKPELELRPGLDLLGPIHDKYVQLT